MNLTEFLEELSKTRNGWMAECSIRKRARAGVHCPITAVCVRLKKTRFTVSEVDLAGKRLGLSRHLTDRIIDAADLLTDRAEPRLRSRLLKAVGLK